MRIYVFIILFFLSLGAFAQTPVPAASVAPERVVFIPSQEPAVFVPPTWLKDAMLFVTSVPVVGPIAVEVFKWLGVLASLATALFGAFFAIVRTLSGVLNLAGLVGLATKLDRFYLIVAPYLKFFSIFNAQKEEFKGKSGPLLG